jgi:hypothetical protein
MPFDLTGALPFDQDALGPDQRPRPEGALGAAPFAYIGKPYTADEFVTYVNGYDFGTIPPDYVVLHHTAIPSTVAARFPTGAVWDGGEGKYSIAQKRQKRGQQLDALRDYYRDTMRWSIGPHLFIDELFIWAFSPMREVGIHAATGNSTRIKGKLHYSIGIEVVGYYEKVVWPEQVAQNVGRAVSALRNRLGTFDLTFKAGPGGICSHRNFNKPQCPGAAITESYYLNVLNQTWNATHARVMPAPGQPARDAGIAVDTRLKAAWEQSGGVWKPNELTPGLPTRAAEDLGNGVVQQRFERAVARRAVDGTVNWLLLDEIQKLAP